MRAPSVNSRDEGGAENFCFFIQRFMTLRKQISVTTDGLLTCYRLIPIRYRNNAQQLLNLSFEGSQVLS